MAEKEDKQTKYFTYDEYVMFGKYFGWAVFEIVKENPGYIRWLIEKGIAEFDEQTMEALEQVEASRKSRGR